LNRKKRVNQQGSSD